MSYCDMGQVNSILNQCGVYLVLIFFNNPSMLRLFNAERPLLKLGRHHPGFFLTCDNEYLNKCASQFDFSKFIVDEMILQLAAVGWLDLLRSDCCVDESVQKFYDAIYQCFELYAAKYIVKDSTESVLGLTRNFTTLIIP
jgi:hypothetical protein